MILTQTKFWEPLIYSKNIYRVLGFEEGIWDTKIINMTHSLMGHKEKEHCFFGRQETRRLPWLHLGQITLPRTQKCILLFMYCWTQYIIMLLRVFVSIFLKYMYTFYYNFLYIHFCYTGFIKYNFPLYFLKHILLWQLLIIFTNFSIYLFLFF